LRTNNQPSPSALNINSIKILSWNIAKNNHESRWSSDFLAIVEQYQPDKIFLQEVRLCAVERQIPELASMGWSFAPNLIDTLDNTYSGVLIATKADWISRKAQITRHYEPVTRTRKVSLFAEYSLGDRTNTLLAVNTHLINFVELSKFQAQLQGLEAIISQHQGAVIFSGDFNTWNRSRWLLLSEMTAKFATLEKLVEVFSPLPFTVGNKLELLIDGQQTFGEMLDAIAKAQNYILLQSYIINHDHVGNDFKQALIAKAKQGVSISLLYDKIGSYKKFLLIQQALFKKPFPHEYL
jgi:endonuclease/exonuclease/phosphatase family metal-dependent hydrolase